MANFSDVQASINNLNTAVTAATAKLAEASTGISSAEGDTIVAAINSATTTLTNAVTPPAV